MPDIRVLRVISNLDIGGVQRQMLLAFRELRRRGLTCEVCTIDEPGRMAERFAADGFAVHHVPFRSRLDPVGALRLRLLARRRAVHIVHSHMYGANMSTNFALLARGRLRLVNGYHNQIPTTSAHQERSIRRTAGRPDAFVAVGDSVREVLVGLGVPADRITVIHNGVVGPETVAPLPERAPGQPLELLWAGRFVKQKRLDFLVEVAAECQRRQVPVRITLLGDGPGFSKLSRLVAEKQLTDWVRLPGATDDVFGWLARADLFVSASFREGFPNALLEACAAGRPFVVSDIAPHRELLEGRSAGLLLPTTDPAPWAEALAALAADPARLRPMADEALAIGRAHSIAAACDRTVALYEALLAH